MISDRWHVWTQETHKGSEDRSGNTVLQKVRRADESVSELVLLRDAARQQIIVTVAPGTHAVMFGKPETGRPMPAEQISAVTMMSNLG